MVKLYMQKHAITAVDILNDRVCPFFDEHRVPLLRIVIDRGTEYWGNRQQHEYQLYLVLKEFDHTKTQAKSPHTNGICERFHMTILEEFYQIAFRRKIYVTLEALQADLDDWIRGYNQDRPHFGRFCYGKTPMRTFQDSLQLMKDKIRNNTQLSTV